jgi:alkylhydroperoxidase family enzyme
MARIDPLDPPYPDAVAERLEAMMPPGVPPILLFRTFVKNMPMATAMGSWGGYELSRGLSLSLRDRELVIDRTCARCGCEYEWGVHVAYFSARAELSDAQVTSIAHGSPADPCWVDRRDRVLLETVDSLHDTARIGDELWERLAAELSEAEVLDALLLCGWYHAISFVANGVRLDLEDGAPRFADVR